MSLQSVLVVDADPAVVETVRDLLDREGRAVDGAADAAEALDRARAVAYDLILAGEGRNGLRPFDLLRRLRSIRPESKVILMDDPAPEPILRAIKAHAYSYVHKPLTRGPVVDMAQLALRSESWRGDIKVLSAIPEWIALEVTCKLEAAERAAQFARELEAGLPRNACEDVTLAFRELLLNAVEHGGRSDPRKRVRVSIVRAGATVIVRVQDPGKGFSLKKLPHAAVSNPEGSPTQHVELRAEEGRRPGGFGILMARSLVDELVYNERGNEAMFVKYVK